jgi:CDP-paratose 2-epimerase
MTFRKILITGGAGFVGSNLALFLAQSYPGTAITALDNLKRRGSEMNLPRLKNGGVRFVHGDIRAVEDLAMAGDFDLMIECSAEPSVLAGYDAPRHMVNTNLMGAVNCLDLCKKHGAAFFFISTSRVYSIEALSSISLDEEHSRFWPSASQSLPGITRLGIGEEFPVTGQKSLYGAAKYCAEMIAAEYDAAFGVPHLINRCSILTGPWQMGKADQGVMAWWILRHLFNLPLSYIGFNGSGKQVRDFLDIDDYIRLVAMQLERFDALKGSCFNVGGGPERALSLMELTDMVRCVTGVRMEVSGEPATRPGDIPYFVSDMARVSTITGWKPEIPAERTIERVSSWFSQNRELAKQLLGL